MNRLYASIWAIIFLVVGEYLAATDSAILNILGYGFLIMFGLTLYTLYKSFGR